MRRRSQRNRCCARLTKEVSGSGDLLPLAHLALSLSYLGEFWDSRESKDAQVTMDMLDSYRLEPAERPRKGQASIEQR